MTRQPLLHPVKAKRKRPEASLQKAVVQIVMLAGNPDVLWFSIPNERRASARGMAELKRMGLRPGAADMCFVINGRAHFLELKADRGKQSDNQVRFQADCVIAGAHYQVADNINKANAILKSWGVLRGPPMSLARAA